MRRAWTTVSLVGLSVAIASLALTTRARAAGDDPAAAQALFEDGKRAMQAHDYAAGCPKLAESFRLDPAGGTALALALCHEAEGKTATAWADFDQAVSIARRDHRPERESAALARGTALEHRLVRVRIVVQAEEPGLEIARDGTAIGKAQWGVDVPVDPGTHAFEARAPGKASWQGSVTTGAEGSTVSVEVPPLLPAALPVPPEAAPTHVAVSPVLARAPSPPREDHGSWSAQKTWALVAGGVGLAGVAVGAGFGAAAASSWSGAESACPGDLCKTVSAKQQGASAGHEADVSTVAFIAGGAGLALGTILFLTAPSRGSSDAPRAASLRVGLSPLGFSIGGSL